MSASPQKDQPSPRLGFLDWTEVLAAASPPAPVCESYALTVRGYLGFCRRDQSRP